MNSEWNKDYLMSNEIDYKNLPKTSPSLPPEIVLDTFANELRRVTASIRGYTMLLKDGKFSSEQQLYAYEAIEGQVDRVTALIDNVKTYLEERNETI